MSEVTSFNINGKEYEITSDSSTYNSDIILNYDDSDADLNIGDDSGNVLVQFQDGHIKTQNFNSSDITNDSQEINILFVGNSLTQDAVSYVPLLLKEIAPEIKFRLYDWYNAGSSLTQQYNEFFLTDNTADIFSIFDSTTDSSWTNYNSSKNISWVLSNCDFDVVVFQEYSYYDISETDEQTIFDTIVDFFRQNYSKPFKVVSFMDAPMRSRVETDFQKAQNYCSWQVQNSDSDGIIPCGAAVYYALSTDLDSLGDQGHLSPDGTHTQEGLPCLLQSYVITLWIFEQLGIAKSIINSQTRITQSVYNALNVMGPNLGTGVVTGTDEQHYIAQDCAVKAHKLGKKLYNNI